MEKRKHIKNYYKARRLLQEYFKKSRKQVLVQNDEETAEQYEARNEQHRKWLDKFEKEYTDRLERADNAGEVFELEFHVRWGRNYEGSQARCEGFVFYTCPEFGSKSSRSRGKRTGGGGYDKYSAAIQLCIDRFDEDALAAIDRWVIENGERLWKEYAVERTPIPHFNFGGKGGLTFTRLFRRIGYQYKSDWPIRNFLIEEDRRNGKYDYIHIIRKDKI